MLRSTSGHQPQPIGGVLSKCRFPWLSEISVWVERNAIEDAPIIRVPVTLNHRFWDGESTGLRAALCPESGVKPCVASA